MDKLDLFNLNSNNLNFDDVEVSQNHFIEIYINHLSYLSAKLDKTEFMINDLTEEKQLQQIKLITELDQTKQLLKSSEDQLNVVCKQLKELQNYKVLNYFSANTI